MFRNGTFLLLLIYMCSTIQAKDQDQRPYHERTPYYYESAVSMNWTAKGTGLENRIAYINEVVEEYTKSNTTPVNNINKLFFERLPLDEYKVEKVYKQAFYESNLVYKLELYISHDNKNESRWVTAEETYSFARFICFVTESETSCSVSYNLPDPQGLYVLLYVFVGLIVAVGVALFIVALVFIAHEAAAKKLLHKWKWPVVQQVAQELQEDTPVVDEIAPAVPEEIHFPVRYINRRR